MEKFYNDALMRVKRIVDEEFGGNYSAACRKWGIKSVSTVTQWFSVGLQRDDVKSHKSASLRTVGMIFDQTGISFNQVKDPDSNYDFVRKTTAMAGAGSSLVTCDSTVGYYAFRKDFLGKIGVSDGNCVLMDVIGESMQPTLHDGDSILVDTGDTTIRDGKVYVVTLDDELLVKRVFRRPGGLLLKSDNLDFPSVEVDGNAVGHNVIVRGRVRWYAGTL